MLFSSIKRRFLYLFRETTLEKNFVSIFFIKKHKIALFFLFCIYKLTNFLFPLVLRLRFGIGLITTLWLLSASAMVMTRIRACSVLYYRLLSQWRNLKTDRKEFSCTRRYWGDIYQHCGLRFDERKYRISIYIFCMKLSAL